MRYLCGIDSGKQGALVVIKWDFPYGEIVGKYVMPLKEKDIDMDGLCSLIDKIQLKYKPRFVLERLQPIFGAGKGSQFSMAQTYGIILGMLHCSQVEYILIRPKNWQGNVISPQDVVYKDPNAKRKVRDTKQTALNAAQRLYPMLDLRYGDNETRRGKDRRTKQNEGLVDALLIAYSQL